MGRKRHRSNEEDDDGWIAISNSDHRRRSSSRFPLQGRVFYSCLTAILIFFGCQYLLLMHERSAMEDEKMTAENSLHFRQKRLDEMQMQLADRDRQIHRLERRMHELEQRAKSQHARRGGKELRTIYFITPTYDRPTQKADLTRLMHTLMHVANLFWLLVEDADHKSAKVAALLVKSGLRGAHLNVKTPAQYETNPSAPNWLYPRGVLQRNAALAYLRTNMHADTRGLVYFGDDDNAYDLQLFDEMRKVQKLGVWPVGLVGGLLVERPVVGRESGRIVQWLSMWKPERQFPIDMAAFAVTIRLLHDHPQAVFSYQTARGYQESLLLTGLGLKREDAEPLADGCTKVLVWHTRTEKPKLKNERLLRGNRGIGSDDGIFEL